MTEPVVKLSAIGKIYPGTTSRAVDDFSLEIYKGEFFCLVGPSGCGKSTVLKMIADIDQPTSGQLTKPEVVSMVFQSGALFPWLDVFDNVSFGLRMQDESESKIDQITKKYLQMVGLSRFALKYPRDLSGGQRQRVGIARALAVEPDVLLLDEPFSALDPLTTDELHKDLLDIWKGTGKTILMVSHSLEEAVILADRIGVMSDGKLKTVLEVKLPRPRGEREKGFVSEVEKIKGMFI